MEDTEETVTIRVIQQELRALGYYNGKITGTFDAATMTAFWMFKMDYVRINDQIEGIHAIVTQS